MRRSRTRWISPRPRTACRPELRWISAPARTLWVGLIQERRALYALSLACCKGLAGQRATLSTLLFFKLGFWPCFHVFSSLPAFSIRSLVGNIFRHVSHHISHIYLSMPIPVSKCLRTRSESRAGADSELRLPWPWPINRLSFLAVSSYATTTNK